GSRRAGRGGGASRWASAAADQRGDAGGNGVLDLLRADEVDMRVDTARGQDFAFAGDDLSARADDNVDTRLNVRIAGLADSRDASVGDRDVRLHDTPVIDDQRVGDDRVGGTLGLRCLRLPHAIADNFAAAELHFLAVGGEVVLHLDNQVGVR